MYQHSAQHDGRLLRRLGLAAARRGAPRPGLRDGFFADPARVEDDYLRLRRSQD